MNKNEPYIRLLELDSESHLIISKSDGTTFDAGYMPTHSIDIHVREEDDNHERYHKITSTVTG